MFRPHEKRECDSCKPENVSKRQPVVVHGLNRLGPPQAGVGYQDELVSLEPQIGTKKPTDHRGLSKNRKYHSKNDGLIKFIFILRRCDQLLVLTCQKKKT